MRCYLDMRDFVSITDDPRHLKKLTLIEIVHSFYVLFMPDIILVKITWPASDSGLIDGSGKVQC